MDTILLWLAVFTAATWLLGAIEMGVGTRSVKFLAAQPRLDTGDHQPSVSIIIAARDEAAELEPALRSLLKQDYSSFELIAVNDRSVDRTGEILERLSETDPRLRVIHIQHLPEGWLGKTHALQKGAEAASGEWLLFTDADVSMREDTLSRALRIVQDDELDHLTASPELLMSSVVADAFAGIFSLFFARYAKPWKANDPDSSHHVGVGAFNLVRTSAYHSAGGHKAIALRPDDDLRLGRLMKSSGFRQDVVFGRDSISVPWYSSIGEMVVGLEKNSFAGFNYSAPLAVTAALFLILLNTFPWIAIFFTTGPAFVCNLTAVLIMGVVYASSAKASGATYWGIPLFPFGSLFFSFVILRSTFLAIKRGGIIWRDTFYPLDKLRNFQAE